MADQWALISTENGVQVRKSTQGSDIHQNIVHCKTLKRALEFVQNASTLGDTIDLYVEDVPLNQIFS